MGKKELNRKKQERLRLLLVVPMLHQGGFERVCVRTARIMEPWFDVTIALFSAEDIAYDITGLQLVNLDVPAAKSRVQKIANVGRRVAKLGALKKQLQPDISYSFGPTANLINVLTRTGEVIWTGVRSYMDMDNPRKLRLFLRRSDRVICCSKLIAGELKQRFKAANTEVLYNPYDSRQIAENARQVLADMPDFTGKKVMISVGREDDCKEFWHLIKALWLMKDRVPEAALCIVGEGSFTEYKELTERLGLSHRVYFAGLQKNPFPWLAKSTLYVGVSSMEGFPNALVEGMSCGLPAVFSNCRSGPAEILSDRFYEVCDRQEVLEEAYGLLIPVMSDEKNLDPADISQEERRLAEVLEALLLDEGRLGRMAKAARGRADSFSDAAYARQILRIAKDCGKL